MSLDIATLHLCNSLMNATYGVMFVALWISQRHGRHFLVWGVAHLSIAIGVAGFALLGRTDFLVSAALISSIAFGIVAIWVGCRLFDGRAPLRLHHLVLALLPGAGFLAGAIGLGDPRLGQVLTVSALAVISSGLALTLLRRGETAKAFPRLAAGLASFAFLPAYLVSALSTMGILALPNEGAVVLIADQILTNILAVALLAMTGERRRRKLADLALVDGLTGALNRTGLEHRARLRRAGDTADRAVLLADLDHFKAINDRYGHPAGDSVLRHFVQLASEIVTPADTIARVGGEEFVLLLSPADEARATRVAEELRAAVEALAADWNGVAIQATVSIGVAALRPGESVASATERADHALYLAKTAGRNRVSA